MFLCTRSQDLILLHTITCWQSCPTWLADVIGGKKHPVTRIKRKACLRRSTNTPPWSNEQRHHSCGGVAANPCSPRCHVLLKPISVFPPLLDHLTGCLRAHVTETTTSEGCFLLIWWTNSFSFTTTTLS